MKMFLIDVAEWCVEALVLALAFFFFAVGLFILMMIISIAKQAYQKSEVRQTLENIIKNA
tara:strand:- start:1659 stop:1838 length:180 start_codon:yes stop_codon:yes gene_type:complete